MNQESEYHVRPIYFFLMTQKSAKNCTKDSFKKLTFTTPAQRILKGFFVSSKNCIFVHQFVCRHRKNRSLFEKRLSFAHLSTTLGESFTLLILLLISSREAGCECKLLSSFGLTRPIIESKFTISAADVLSTRLMIKNNKLVR